MELKDDEKELLENWEFQGAEYFIHMKRAEEKNTLERRVCTLGDKYVLSTVLSALFYPCKLKILNMLIIT